MNRSGCTVRTFWRRIAVSVLLQKSRTSGPRPSQTVTMMTPVHAAPVGYLPPPGASPAAVTPCHTGNVLRSRPMRLRTKVTLLFGVIALVATVTLTVVTYAFARNSLLEQRTELASRQGVSNAQRVLNQLRGDSTNFGE